jgi:hypothetical protein
MLFSYKLHHTDEKKHFSIGIKTAMKSILQNRLEYEKKNNASDERT